MKPVTLLQPASQKPEDLLKWCVTALQTIERASHDDTSKIADSYTVTSGTTNRALNPSTATVAQVAQVLGTYLTDMKQRGVNRTQVT